jgi:hypothetical protein
MKRKLIVTLIASALELYAAAAGAQVSCQATDAQRTVRTGPLNPVDGFPEYVADSNNVSVQRCLNPAVCFFDPIVTTDPFSLQIGSGGEAFYWSADAVVSNAAGGRILTVVMAAETAFLQGGPNGEPINGSQFPFLRLRFVAGVPTDGIYTIKHPYGTDTFTVVGATGARDIFSTVDRGFAPNDADVLGPVGPFLVSATRPAGYLGNANGAADRVTGSPCGRDWNRVEITGRTPAGLPIDFGSNEFVLSTNNFVVQGAVYDGRVQTALNPTRMSYSRAAGGAGQIDAFVASSATARVTVQDGPTTPVGASQIANAVTLDHAALDANSGINAASVAGNNLSVLPPVLQLTASEAPGGAPTDLTRINVGLVDFVDIASAEYDPFTKVLSISAVSGDQLANPVLTVRDMGTFTAGNPVFKISTNAPPGVVHVDSAGGGSASAKVRVISSAPPAAPTNLAASGVHATSLTLTWTDNATNEVAYTVYRIGADGTRTQLTTLSQNSTRFVVTGLSQLTAYRFQVFATNAAGNAGSTILDVSTIALPATPTPAVAALSTTQVRAINVSWADNANDETGYVISRATSAAGPFVQVATAPANATSVVDTFGPPGLNVTYTYRVTAVRDTDISFPAQVSVGPTPSVGPARVLAPTFLTTPSAITVNWLDNSTNESGFDIYRSASAAGPWVKMGSTVANTTQFVDSTVTAGATYFYRVNAYNYVVSNNGFVSAAVIARDQLNPVENLAVTNIVAVPPSLTWVDKTGVETGYRVQRRSVTLSNAGGATRGAFATVGITAPDATGYIDTTAAANAIFEYSVAAVNGADVGPAVTVLAVPGGVARVAAAPTWNRNRDVVTINWTQAGTSPLNRASVGGYKVERCTLTITDTCANNSAGWTTTVATVFGRTTLRATDTVPVSVPARSYRYRIVSTTGALTTVPGVTGVPSATSIILTR